MDRRGFTVVELVAVIGIIGILTAIFVPAITASLNNSNLDIAARQLEADLRWMQQLAVNSGGDNLPDIQFYNAPPYKYYISINSKVIKSVFLPANVRFNKPPPQIFWGINGYLNGGNTIALQSGVSIRYVAIDFAGRIRVY